MTPTPPLTPEPTDADRALWAKLFSLSIKDDIAANDHGRILIAQHVAAVTAPWKQEVERYRMQVLAIMSAYASNHTAIPQEHPHWSQCYEDVCRIVARTHSP